VIRNKGEEKNEEATKKNSQEKILYVSNFSSQIDLILILITKIIWKINLNSHTNETKKKKIQSDLKIKQILNFLIK